MTFLGLFDMLRLDDTFQPFKIALADVMLNFFPVHLVTNDHSAVLGDVTSSIAFLAFVIESIDAFLCKGMTTLDI